eukprot:gene7303-9950_t
MNLSKTISITNSFRYSGTLRAVGFSVLTTLQTFRFGGKYAMSMTTNNNFVEKRGVIRLPTQSSLKSASQVTEERDMVSKCITFLDSCPEPFICVAEVSSKLVDNGFLKLEESAVWRNAILPKGKYFFVRNGSSIVAFVVGGKFQTGNGYKILCAHTDSPNLKLKPNSKRSASGLIQLNVECYGGGLWHTWFDRDLSIAGRVLVKSINSNGDLSFNHKLVKVNEPVLRIPNLCIHLRSADERESFKINKEDHLIPILCEEVKKSLSIGNNTSSNNSSSTPDKEEPSQWSQSQEPELLSLIANQLKCDSDDIVDFELSLFDTQKATLSGYKSEFLCSSRIDNLASCFVTLEALLSYANDGLDNEEEISILGLFDHEEVGSESYAGAGSNLIADSIARISQSLYNDGNHHAANELHQIALAKSFILSVDMAHAVHPNYASKHEKNHSPMMNSGVVIKSNSNQRYATSGITGFITRELARQAGVPIQEFAVRNDCPCGSTIGPILSSKTGIRAVDLGMPQLSMHSIREMMGASDLNFAHKLFTSFLKDFRKIDDSLKS